MATQGTVQSGSFISRFEPETSHGEVRPQGKIRDNSSLHTLDEIAPAIAGGFTMI